MRKLATIAGVTLAATTLGGCQLLGGPPMAHRSDNVDMGEYFEQRLAAGRLHLEENRPTKAITAFRQAAYDPRVAADAYNGMAVAYDRIGRADLAARYFAEAVKADPSDERFARNLARLEGRALAAPTMPTLRDETPGQLAVTDFGAQEVRGPITIQKRPEEIRGPVQVEKAPRVALSRTAKGQVSVAPTEHSNVVRMVERLDDPAGITVESRRSSAQRVAQRVRRNAQARRGYPIRIVLRDDNAKRP